MRKIAIPVVIIHRFPLKNENVTHEMMSIMEELQAYAPKFAVDTNELNCEHFHKLLLGAYQLTAARCKSAQQGRSNEVTPSEQLKGFVSCGGLACKAVLVGVAYACT